MTTDNVWPVPSGFEPIAAGGPFIEGNGPLYVRDDGGGRVRVGLRIQRRHCNTMGTCHGGMLATFADMMMPLSMYATQDLVRAPRFLPTASLQMDFLGPAFLDDWIEGEVQILKTTRSMIFAQGLVRAGGDAVLRCSGVYKISAPIPDGHAGMYTAFMPDTVPRRN